MISLNSLALSFIAETTQSFSFFNSSRENRPVEYSVWFLSQIKAGLGQGGPRPSTPPASSLNEIPRQEVDDNLIKKNLRQWQTPLMLSELETQFQLLSAHCDYLKERGCKIIFFETPLHPKISESIKAKMIRERLAERFSDTKLVQISAAELPNYQTKDGIHLDQESARKYSLFLSQQESNKNLKANQ